MLNGIRISGSSGIFKSHDYYKGMCHREANKPVSLGSHLTEISTLLLSQ